MNNKASIANLLNDCNTTSPCEIQNQKNSLNLYNKRNIFPSRFTNIEKRQPLSTTTTTTTTTTTFTTTELMEHPRQSDTTIISGVQIVTNDDPSVLPHHPFNHPPFPNSNWLPPLHPLYTYDPLPRMPVYKKSKKKQSSINGNTKTEVDVGMVNVSIIRPKRNYTKKPLDRLKRPRNGYMIYMNEVYEDVKRNNPDLKFGELSALIGVQWKSMSKSEQMPYHQKHEEEKSAYESAKLAMSRSNLQIVEETIGIERQVKAAELKAAQIRSKKQSSQPKLIHNERHEPDADNRNDQLHQSDAVIQPSMNSCKLLRQDIPITPVSPNFDDQALQRETQRVKFFKHLNEESSLKEPITITTPQSDEKGVNENDYHNIKEVIEIIDDDEEEQIDQLQPSDSSDIEETDVIEDSSTFIDQSPETQEDLTATQVDTSRIWYLPINGTRVSSGLTSPHRKRKIVRVEEPEEVIFVPKRFKKKIEEYLEREREKES